MSLPSALLSAYREWRELDVSFTHLEMGQRLAPTYDVENDLDHLHSSLCAQMDEIMTHSRSPHRSIAGETLAALSHIEAELDRIEVGFEERQSLRAYIAATRALAEELERLPPQWGAS
ncbi:MAG TPA: hypothetical protein VGP25_13760 [Gemmatimonadaceae bacterium]|jgi:hypothetical protein|nr:hypothetical protein [Gemmatimonadaceae bacterium]